MTHQISRYQPRTADSIDPQTHGLSDRELATFTLGVVATRLTSGMRTGFNDEVMERCAARILAGSPDDRDGLDLRTYFANQWGRLCDLVQSDRTINATGRPPVSHE